MPSQYEELARGALLEITTAGTIGDCIGETAEGDGAVSILFLAKMLGYPGWRWTVSIGQVDGSEPTVLEAELMPGDGSLLSPDWVPWSDRLADYKATQEALGLGEEGSAADPDDSDHDPDDDDDDDDDVDDDDVLDRESDDDDDIDDLDDDADEDEADDDSDDDGREKSY